jgi:hypothetical protein
VKHAAAKLGESRQSRATLRRRRCVAPDFIGRVVISTAGHVPVYIVCGVTDTAFLQACIGLASEHRICTAPCARGTYWYGSQPDLASAPPIDTFRSPIKPTKFKIFRFTLIFTRSFRTQNVL